MNAIATAPAKPAASSWRRSAFAVFAGLLANVVMSSATDLLLVAGGVFPPLSEFGRPESFSDSMLLLALTYRTVFGVLGCYLAPKRSTAHAVVLGTIGVVVGVIGATATWDTWTQWYSLAIIAVPLPSAWLGAWILQRSRRHSHS